jgi:GT2 family glycosyltransferase
MRSIKKHTTDINYEIILIDNAPKKNYKSIFEKEFIRLKYILSEVNIGFGRANNLGMAIAKGEYFLLLNSDTLLINNSLKQCLDFLESEHTHNIGLIGCRLLNEDGSYQGSFYPYIQHSVWNYLKSNNPLLFKLFNVQKDFQEKRETCQVGDISGAFMLLRRAVYENVNGFDPDFFLYCEETDWCRNRIAKYYDIYYFPHAEVIHLGGKSAPKKLMYLQSQLSLALFWYKKSIPSYLLYILFSWLNGLYYVLTYPLSSVQSKEKSIQYLRGLAKTLPYLVLDIPKYNRAFNSRKEGLVLEEAKSTFFSSE